MVRNGARRFAGQRWVLLLVFLALAALILLGSSTLSAAGFPEKPITFIVPWPAGGGSDIMFRTICQFAEKHIEVPIVVLNKPGGGGAVGVIELANSPADGYTIGMASISIVVTQYMSEVKTPLSAYVPVAFVGSDDSALTVRADSPWKTLDEFVAYAKANPGKIRNANDTAGGGSHLAALELENVCDVKLNLIPYPGFAPSVAALAGGHVDSTTVPVPDVYSLAKSGEFRVLGVLGPERHFLIPDVPTFKEQGYDGEMGIWRVILAPKKLAPDRLAILEEAFIKAMNEPELQKAMQSAGWKITPKDSAWTAEFLKEEDAKIHEMLARLDLVMK